MQSHDTNGINMNMSSYRSRAIGFHEIILEAAKIEETS